MFCKISCLMVGRLRSGFSGTVARDEAGLLERLLPASVGVFGGVDGTELTGVPPPLECDPNTRSGAVILIVPVLLLSEW